MFDNDDTAYNLGHKTMSRKITGEHDRVAVMPAPAPSPPRGEFVQGIKRGFDVIKAFAADSNLLTISEVAARTGLTRAVARRYLLTLERLGYVFHDGSAFALTPRILDLGFTYLSTIDVANVGQQFMEKVVNTLHETCSLAVLDGDETVYICRVPAKRIMSINLVVGSRLPAHATSMGKILLAYLPPKDLDAYFRVAKLQMLTKRTICREAALRQHLGEVRNRGWAISDQETEDGIRTIAAPVFERSGDVHAAVNVSGHASRVSVPELRRDYLPVLLEAARGISMALGARPEANPVAELYNSASKPRLSSIQRTSTPRTFGRSGRPRRAGHE